MGLFNDLSKFLETRLEEFLRAHPHLELQALDEQLREQEEGTLRLIGDLKLKEKQLEDQILETAQEVQRWHIRVDKAKAAKREDLLRAAEEREATLLRQGNQLWGQMQGVKERGAKAKELQDKIQTRRREIRAKAAQVNADRARTQSQSSWDTGWNQTSSSTGRTIYGSADPLEQVFERWEADEELERMKRNMGR